MDKETELLDLPEELPDCIIEVTLEDDAADEDSANVSMASGKETDSRTLVEQNLDKSCQCNMRGSGKMRVQSLAKEDEAIFLYFTGYKGYKHFSYVFSCLGPAAFELGYQCSDMQPEDEFLLTLMKLRLNKEDIDLAFTFGIGAITVGKIFRTWIAFLFFQLKELNLWLPHAVVQETMPQDFLKKYPTTRVIIDGTEIGIQKPGNVRDQAATWSSYKNKNTLKVLVGISPKGVVTFVSDAYGGSASDRQIF